MNFVLLTVTLELRDYSIEEDSPSTFSSISAIAILIHEIPVLNANDPSG
jgi:hypothetical protein